MTFAPVPQEDFKLFTLTIDNTDSPHTASSETIILCNAASGAITVTLPASTDSTDRTYYIKKTDSSANVVTIDGNASETIDGELTLLIGSQYDSATIACDGSNWHLI